MLACGLSGIRRLRHGPLRDRVLEVTFVTADGRLIRGGGPTVKNVSGFDMPRLLVGSFGTLGVIVECVLRCQPSPATFQWATTDVPVAELRARAYRPSALLWDGTHTAVLVEGHPGDIDAELRTLGAEARPSGPNLPVGPHRGRISIRPSVVAAVGAALDAVGGVRWLAEVGVGTVHVAADDPATLGSARDAADRLGGWLLREQGAPALDGFGRPLANLDVTRRIRDAFDPTRKLAPGRLPE